MHKSLLGLYIQRVAAGDQSFVDRLISQLSERLLFIPIEQRTADGCRIKVTIVQEAYRTLIPAFTSEAMFEAWCRSHNRSTDKVALLGADLSVALTGSSWLWVNPGSDSPIELQPFLVERLSQVAAAPQPSADVGVTQTIVLEEQEIIPDPLREPHYLSGATEVAAQVPYLTESIEHTQEAEVKDAKLPDTTPEAQEAVEPPKKKGSFLNYLRSST